MSTTPESEHRRDPDEPHHHTPTRGDTHARRLEREHEAFGGMKLGSGFFGWLTATGTAALLLTVLAAAGLGAGAVDSAEVDDAADQASANLGSLVTVTGIVLLVVLFVAYFCGGYVAGRMARLDGLKQGLAVWLWAVLFVVLVALIGAVAGDRFDIWAQVETLGLPVTLDELTVTAIVAAVVVAVVTLVGALLGGRAGMHYHRKLDRAGMRDVV